MQIKCINQEIKAFTINIIYLNCFETPWWKRASEIFFKKTILLKSFSVAVVSTVQMGKKNKGGGDFIKVNFVTPRGKQTGLKSCENGYDSNGTTLAPTV